MPAPAPRPPISCASASVVHELATSAAKYGALSDASGTVDVAWSITDNVLRLEWRESNGPAADPERKGFGSS